MKLYKFYSLAYFDLQEKRFLKGKERSSFQRIDIFIKNAYLLDKSLKWFGDNELILLTNNKQIIEDSFKRCNLKLKYEIMEFNLKIPHDIPFYSAHYKIEAFKYLGQKNDQYSILLDNDVVQLNPFSSYFYKIIENNIPSIYLLNINDKVLESMRKIDDKIEIPLWTGGEWWGGDNKFFNKLFNQCINILPQYLNNYKKQSYHTGDEMVTSISISHLWENNFKFIDISHYNILERYWGYHEKFYINHNKKSLYHLPADKVWISELNFSKISTPSQFVEKYNRHYFLYKIRSFYKIFTRK